MKHTLEFTHFFLYHLLPIATATAVFLAGIYLMIKDANNVLKGKKSRQRLVKHIRKRKK